MTDHDPSKLEAVSAANQAKKEWPFIVWILIGVVAGVLTRWLLLK